ncbi:hypothetical protein LTR86_008579 [Recurvomyces mirabilis]|nr:hypothetical protein LTR86_008579 [Recurvomyces mirabilis]
MSCIIFQDLTYLLQQAWLHILAQAENGTLVACDTNATTSCNNTVPAWEVQAALAGALMGQPDFPTILEALAAAYAGDAALFLGGGSLTIDATWGLVEICNDHPVTDKSFAHYKHLIDIASRVDTYRVNQSAGIQAQLICAAWPYAGPVAPKPLQLTQTMLLVTADFEASIATEQTTFVWETQAHKSGLVVRHGDDHVSFNEPLVASTNITKQFLRTGVLPCPEDSTYVTVYGPGGKRRPVSNPYDVPTGVLAGDIDSL